MNGNSQHYGVLAVCRHLVVTPEAGSVGVPISADEDDETSEVRQPACDRSSNFLKRSLKLDTCDRKSTGF